MTLTLRTRALALSAAVATLAAALVSFPATPLAPASSAAADNPSCIAPYFNVGNLINPPHQQTDPDVGTYVSGNLLISNGASEMEGTFVIGQNATFNSGAYFNVGTVGAGSQYVPAPGSDMLTVGGDLTIPSAFDVEVGNLDSPTGGDVVVGGTVSAADQLQLQMNGGTLTQGGGAGVITPYAPVAALYSGLSTQFSALANTGTVTTDAGNVNFTSTNSDTRQVFTVAGNVLGTLASTKSINFINMPTDAIIIVNVTGTTAVLSSNVFTLNGVSINPTAPEPNRVFSHLTQSLLWNFASATSVTLGRQDQLLGSILVPTAGSNTQLLTSTNGRLYINGNLTLGGGTTESGLEIHNYPFRNCALTTGSLAITKALSDPTDVVDNARVFTGTYSCVNSVPTVVASGTWSAAAGATQTITGLPAGATCSILEDALVAPPTALDTSYVWGSPTYSSPQVIGLGTTVTITATNSFTRQTGSLAITKALTDPDSVVTVGRLFTGTYSCDPQTGADVTGTWSVAAGATQTVTGIPAGSTCTILEDTLSVAPSGDPSYVWAAPSYSPASVVTANGTTVTLTATNTVLHNQGSLAITKTLSDPSDVVDNARAFTGTYSCVNSVPTVVASGTWSVTVGATQTVTGIPSGAVCTIAEDTLSTGPSADPSYVWGTPAYSPTSGTVTTGGTVTLTAQNSFTRQTGSLAITKALTDPDDVVATGRLFTGSYSCDPQSGADVTGTWSVEAGDTQTVTGIPAGSTCTILEDALSVAPSSDPSYVWGTPTYSPASVVTANGTTVTLTANNTVLHNTGSLAITKTLSDPTDVVDNARAFTGTYSCTPLVGALITGTWSVMVGATQTVTGLPAGAVCTITENAVTVAPTSADTSYVWGTPTYSPTSGTITTGGTATITAQNSFTRQTGSFAITKALTDPDSVVASGRLFTGTYTCEPQTGADITGTWSVEEGDTQTVTGIPLGSSCSIDEDALTVAPSADPSYAWGAPTYSPSTVTTTGGTVTITATNLVTQGTGSFTIAKALAGTSSVVTVGRHFTGTYSCATGSTPITGTWDVTTTASQTVSGIPAGASCSITEDTLTVAPSSTDSSYLWTAPSYSPSAATITDGGNITITATNTVRRALGDLQLVKVLDDPFDVVLLTRVYTGTFDCVHNSVDITPAPGTWSTTAGAPAITLATNLPAGTVCTVAEDPLTDPPLVGYPQYQWRPASYSPTTITITDGVTGRFTVTNTVFDPFALLAQSGTDAGLPLIIGGASMLAGLLAVLFGYRRRRRSA